MGWSSRLTGQSGFDGVVPQVKPLVVRGRQKPATWVLDYGPGNKSEDHLALLLCAHKHVSVFLKTNFLSIKGYYFRTIYLGKWLLYFISMTILPPVNNVK